MLLASLEGDSPRGGEMSRSDRGDRALFALAPQVTEGWFPKQNLKIFWGGVEPLPGGQGALRPQARFGGQPP